MACLRRIMIICVTVVFVCIVLAVVFSAYYQEPNYEIKKGDYLRYRTFQTNNNTLKDIEIIQRKDAILLTPERRLHKLCDHLNTVDRSRIISPEYSKLAFVTIKNDRAIIVLIHTYDMLNRPNTSGDDVIVIWAAEKNGDGRVSGEIVDHKNGSYTGILKLFWSGPTTIYAKLASSIINTCLRMKAISKYGNAVFAMQQGWGIRGTYENDGFTTVLPCGANPIIFGFLNICNFTAINGGMPWYCGKPKSKHLSCSDIRLFGTGKFNTGWARPEERIQNPGHGRFRSTVTINAPSPYRLNMSEVKCKDSPSRVSWESNVPSGYWRNDAWHMTHCISDVKETFEDYRSCLRGKTIVIIGDSTLRQYADFILRRIMGIDSHSVHEGANGLYHDISDMHKAFGITLRYLKHEMPFHNPGLPSLAIQSTPRLLDAFARTNITELVVIVNYNSHFTAYPPTVLRHSQRELSKALHRLSTSKPSAKLFVKTPHLVIDDTRWFDPHIQLLDDVILREEFSNMRDNVVLLDTWATSVAHDSQLLHPEKNALQSQIYQLLSYLC